MLIKPLLNTLEAVVEKEHLPLYTIQYLLLSLMTTLQTLRYGIRLLSKPLSKLLPSTLQAFINQKYPIRRTFQNLLLRLLRSIERNQVCFRNVRNSSFVKPASDMIASNNPLFISLCFGTGTMFSFLMRIRWLPFVERPENQLL